MTSKEELITILIPGLVKSTSSSAKEVRTVLNTYEMDGLEREMARQRKLGLLQTPVEDIANDSDILRQVEAIRAEVRREYENNPERIREQQEQERESAEIYRDYALTQLFKTWVPGRGFAVRNKASEALIISWLNLDENLTVDWFLRIFSENPQLASGLQWTQTKNTEAQSLAQDQQTFNAVAKALRSFGVTQANVSLARSVLGAKFSYVELQNAIANGTLQLSPASRSELDKWLAEDIETHNRKLQQASATELRALAKQESEQKRAEEQTRSANESYEVSKQKDMAIGFPPLPAELTKEQIRNAPSERIRYWLKKFGQAQIDARLQSRS